MCVTRCEPLFIQFDTRGDIVAFSHRALHLYGVPFKQTAERLGQVPKGRALIAYELRNFRGIMRSFGETYQHLAMATCSPGQATQVRDTLVQMAGMADRLMEVADAALDAYARHKREEDKVRRRVVYTGSCS